MKKFIIAILTAILVLSTSTINVEAKQTDFSYLENYNKTGIKLLSNGNIEVFLKKKHGQNGYIAIDKYKKLNKVYKIPTGKKVILPLVYGTGKYTIYIGYSKSTKMDLTFNVAKQHTVNVKKLNEKRYLSKSFIILGTQSPQIKQLLNTQFKGWQKWSDKEKVIKVTRYFEKWSYSDALASYVDNHWYSPNYKARIHYKNGICYDTSAITASLLRSMGIETKFIGGYFKFDKSTYHAWNEVKLGGKWYTVDNTFNMKVRFEDDWFYPDEPVFEKSSNYIKYEQF